MVRLEAFSGSQFFHSRALDHAFSLKRQSKNDLRLLGQFTETFEARDRRTHQIVGRRSA